MVYRTSMLFLTLALGCRAWASDETTTERNVPEPTRPVWMKTDAALQQEVKFNVTGSSLGSFFALVSSKCGVDMSADPALKECRIIIHAKPEPLYKAMARTQDIMRHGKYSLESCTWDRTEDKTHKYHYMLRRTLKGAAEEKALLNYPKTTAAQWLRQLRDYALLPEAKRKSFSTEWPYLQRLAQQGAALPEDTVGPVAAAVKSLNDDQITALLEQGSVDVPQLLLPQKLIGELQEQDQKQRQRFAESAAQHGFAVPSTPSENTTPSGPMLSLNSDGNYKEGLFNLMLAFHSGSPRRYPIGFAFDTFNLLSDPLEDEALERAQKMEQHPSIDLLAHSQQPQGKVAAMSLNAALNLLHDESGVTIFSEYFPKEMQVLRVTSGKPEYLLSQMCRTFGCEWKCVDGDYVVWSKTWAQDRSADVPQPLLDRWMTSYMQQGRFGLSDYLEMAKLRDGQIPTLERTLAVSGPLNGFNKSALRLLTTLTKREVVSAYKPEGVEVWQIGPQMSNLQQVFARAQILPPVHVMLKQLPKGTIITFKDQIGISDEFWAYQGDKLQPNEKPQWQRGIGIPKR